MVKNIKSKKSWVTELPLTAEAKDSMLENLFKNDLPHFGELFIPGDNFYTSKPPADQARQMLSVLCEFLGIKPGFIGLELESLGGDIPDGRQHTIYLESKDMQNEFVLGATIACALTRYLLEYRKQILLPASDHITLVARATITFGLGLVILNGLAPNYGIMHRWKCSFQKQNSVLKNYPAPSYANLVLGLNRKHALAVQSFSSCLAPWAAKQLHIPTPHNQTHAAKAAQHTVLLNGYKFAGLVWLILLILGVGSFTLFMRIRPVPARVTQAQENVSLLSLLLRECTEKLNYDRRFSDTSDIQAIRNLNARALRCESIENQYKAAQQTYFDATSQ